MSGGWKVGCFTVLFLEYLNECEFIEKSTLDCTFEVNLVPFRWLADFKSNFYCFTRSPLTFKNGRVSVEFSRLWWNDSDDFDIHQHSAHLELQISPISRALLFFMARFWACQVVVRWRRSTRSSLEWFRPSAVLITSGECWSFVKLMKFLKLMKRPGLRDNPSADKRWISIESRTAATLVATTPIWRPREYWRAACTRLMSKKIVRRAANLE